MRNSKAATCENDAQSALWSFKVGLEKDGEGIYVVITSLLDSVTCVSLSQVFLADDSDTERPVSV